MCLGLMTSGFGQNGVFTYQGSLRDGAVPANGGYDFQFSLWAAASLGTQIGSVQPVQALPVANGVFTVGLDFGNGVFDGSARWIQIAVRKSGSEDGFTVLEPRQAVTATPYALYAMTPAGPQGLQGPKGDAGATGAQGEKGPKGDKGDRGADGAMGPKGDQGLSGATGPQGPVGETGATGPQGLKGDKGDKGDSGIPGPQGPAGPTGAQGLQGSKGDIGATGPMGAQGPIGPAGPQGIKGDTGAIGPQGRRGLNFRGTWNATSSYATDDLVTHEGSAWLARQTNQNIVPMENESWTLLAGKGDVGPQGATGPSGPQGQQGLTGIPGPVGPQGTQGAMGATGPQGPQGETGSPGPRGLTGPPGPNTTTNNTLYIGADQNRLSVASRISFGTDANDLMTLLESGSLGLGTTNPQSRLEVVGTIVASAFSGDGAGLTNLPVSGIAGVLAGQQLPSSVVHRNELAATNAIWQTALSNETTSRSDAQEILTAQVAAVTNGLSARLLATNTVLVAALNFERAERLAAFVELEARLIALSNHTRTNVPLGVTVASADAAHPGYLAQGLQRFSQLPAPSWGDVSTSAVMPTARDGHSMIWNGSEALVFGGRVGANSYSGAGSRYSPGLDRWTAMSGFRAPSPREKHGVVWTGVEMVVWGGFGPSGPLGDGGRYATGEQQWRPTSLVNAPSARSEPAMVWTGSRAVVWGGRSFGTYFGDGAVYDPSADSWSSLPTTGAPLARYGAASVWAGDRLIVWGGHTLTGATASGGWIKIDVNGDAQSWQSMNLSNAPTARTDHVAVWTGTRFLVWGGRQGMSALATGASYDPATDTWTILPSLNAPAARFGHLAIWTGDEMVIFGGENGTGSLADGGAYNPVTNRWRSLDNPGIPFARSAASAIWSGSELILFGGQANGQLLAAPQRVQPRPTWHLYRKPSNTP